MNQIAEAAAQHHPTHEIHVAVEYNGMRRNFEISPEATVKILLDRAISAFGNLPQPHTLALWTSRGVELTAEQQTLKEAHVRNGDALLLRPSAVRGG